MDFPSGKILSLSQLFLNHWKFIIKYISYVKFVQ